MADKKYQAFVIELNIGTVSKSEISEKEIHKLVSVALERIQLDPFYIRTLGLTHEFSIRGIDIICVTDKGIR